MYFINEKNSWNQFGYSLVDIFINDFIDFLSEFFGDFSFFGFHNLAHERDEVLAVLRSYYYLFFKMNKNIILIPGIRDIQIV